MSTDHYISRFRYHILWLAAYSHSVGWLLLLLQAVQYGAQNCVMFQKFVRHLRTRVVAGFALQNENEDKYL